MRFLTVDTKYALYFFCHCRPIRLRRRVFACIDDGATLESVKEQKHVADVGFRLAPAIGKPIQIGAAGGCGDLRVTRPVAHLPLGVVTMRTDGLGRIDQAGIVIAEGSLQRCSDVDHSSRDAYAGDFNGLAPGNPGGWSEPLWSGGNAEIYARGWRHRRAHWLGIFGKAG